MNEILFTQEVTLLDFIIRMICIAPIFILMIGFVINEVIIKPIKKLMHKFSS